MVEYSVRWADSQISLTQRRRDAERQDKNKNSTFFSAPLRLRVKKWKSPYYEFRASFGP
jgi:hypothetical protein